MFPLVNRGLQAEHVENLLLLRLLPLLQNDRVAPLQLRGLLGNPQPVVHLVVRHRPSVAVVGGGEQLREQAQEQEEESQQIGRYSSDSPVCYLR